MPNSAEKPLVLFLCTGNSARSQMAEAILRDRASDRFEAASAGLEPSEVNPLTIRALEESQVSTGGLYSKGVTQFLHRAKVRWAIIVCERAQEACPRIYPFARRTLFWPFDDPAAANGSEADRLTVFRRVRDEIAARIDEWLEGECDE